MKFYNFKLLAFILAFSFSEKNILSQVAQESKPLDKTAEKAVSGFAGTVKKPFEKIYDFLISVTEVFEDKLNFGIFGFEEEANQKEKQETLNETLNSGYSWLWKFLMAFFAGWWVSLTPCIYPLIPVTAGILSSGGTLSFSAQVLRSVAYILGLSTVFSTLGYFSAKTTLIFGQWMNNPWVIFFIVLFLLYLAFSMFGFYDINFGIKGLNSSYRGSVFTAYIFGAATGLIASPCMTPALLSILSIVAASANPTFGVGLLFSFSLGMGSILLAIAIFSGLLASLPKPGVWMLEMKKIIGFFIMFLIAGFIAPFLQTYQTMLIYGLILFSISIYYYMSSKSESIINIIRAKKEAAGKEEQLFSSAFHTLSAGIVIKNILAIFAFSWALFFFSRSYLVYNKTTVKKILMKILL